MGRLECGGNLVPWLWLGLGHYGSHEWDWGKYTRKVAKFSMKRCCIVGNRIYGSGGGVANSFNIPIGRYE